MSAPDSGKENESSSQGSAATYLNPSAWVKEAEDFARREPVKAVASAAGAGLLLHLLPIRAILGALLAIVFALARPLLLFLGLLKAWEMCPCKKEPEILP